MAWPPRLVVAMPLSRQNLFPSVNSWASCTLLDLHALQTSGRFASLSPFWLEPSSTRPLRFIYLASELSTSIRGSRIRLQRVVHGIKRCQGTPSSTRLPITDDLMLIIWQSLDLSLPDHVMFWAVCSLGYLRFLRASEFTVPNLSSFSSSLHLSAQDIAVDSPSVLFGDINQTELCMILCLFHSVKVFCI